MNQQKDKLKLNFRYKTLTDVNKIITSQKIEDINNNQKKHLVVVIHGILNGYKLVDPLIRTIDDIYEGYDIDKGKVTRWVPKLPYCCFLSLKKPDDIVKKLRQDLDQIWNWNSTKYTSVRIIGHSLGGVYARALMLEGLKHNSPWAEIEEIRLVLLAAVNRGMGISRHMGIRRVIATALGISLGRLIQVISVGNYEPTIFSGLRGSKFITKMRLDWLIRDQINPLPCTVQLLGSIDNIVAPEDNIDLATGQNFHYLDVPYTGHGNILTMQYKNQNCKEEKGVIDRQEKLKIALIGDFKELEHEEVRPWELKPVSDISEAEKEERQKIKHLVFVIHGIRDEGHWTDKIARRIWYKAKIKEEQDSWEKVVDSYGYFGMGPFLIPGVRWKKVTWFMEKYLETKAKYPKAKFSYVGHSHGTYVLAKALEEYPKCQFENIVFAGSIVRENYNWEQLIQNKQVSRVLNFVATYDWVVALFPNFLGLYNLQDLGGAGHNGFKQEKDEQNHKQIYNVRYAMGDHGAGKREELWDTIADFVLMKDGDSLPKSLSKFLEKKVTKSLPLKSTRPFTMELLGFGNIFIVTGLITIAFVLVPILIIRWWGSIAGLISQIISLITSIWGLRILCLSALTFYIFHAWRQTKEYKRKAWRLRSLVLFPLAFFVNFWIARWSVLGLLSTSYFQDIQPPPIEMWSSAGIVMWLFFVFWILSKL